MRSTVRAMMRDPRLLTERLRGHPTGMKMVADLVTLCANIEDRQKRQARIRRLNKKKPAKRQ
jgi:hypothetical protein